MSSEPKESGELSPAELAFVEFLAEQDTARPADFETFLARHRAVESELRRLHEEWLSVARVLRRGRDEATPRPAHGAPQEPLRELRLDSDGEGLKLEFAGELVGRLARARTPGDRYEPRGELARGGMGVIHRVWDPHLRRQLAMKVILARHDVATPEERGRAMHRALARFLEEAQVTSQLDHPGVVPVHDLGIDGKGRVYFTMRLVRGRDFRHVLELARHGREGWTLARALGVLLKVCEAVAYAHSKGVIHRDLKPANVMVGRFGEVYVMDWGLARVVGHKDAHDLRISTSDTASVSRVDTDVRRAHEQGPGSPLLTMDGRIVGTPSYMSPEQAKGRVDQLGPRSDVYAIGAMLYHLLTGQTPYVPHGADLPPVAVHNLLLDGPPSRVQKLAPETADDLVAICDKAMARDPDDRYAGPLGIAADIEAFLDRRPVTALKPTLGHAARLFFERNRTLSMTVLAALLVLGGVVATAWRKDAEKRRENERLLDRRSAQVLASSIEELFPAVPSHVPAMDRWLADVRELLARAPAHRAELASLRAAGRLEEAALVEPAVRDMDRLERELAPQIVAWRAQAADLGRVSLEVDDRKWQQAIAEIATLPIYGGLKLGKQLGLVPLRKDPGSGLWEFWHVLSGTRPAVDPRRPERWANEEPNGIVLVLVPGAEVELGYPTDDALPNTSSSLHTVRLDPFFIGKHEMTQAQWIRTTGANPSLYPDGIPLEPDLLPGAGRPRRFSTLLHPVESVNWLDCARVLRRLDLEFPSEDQWERAARGGAGGIFWWDALPRAAGDEPIVLGPEDLAPFEARENVADRTCGERHGVQIVPWDDGFQFHAPVGSFAANGFGLFDVLGNVSEWCGEQLVETYVKLPRRIIRGGNWLSADAALLALATRGWDSELVEQSVRGLRVARAIR